MRIKQLADYSVAIRSFDPNDLDENGFPRNYEFLQNTIYDLDEATANFLLNMKTYSDGILCSDFVVVE